MAVTQRLQDASGVIATDELGDILLAVVSSDPSTGSGELTGAGYAKGCILINSGASAHGDLLSANIGTADVANFTIITVASS